MYLKSIELYGFKSFADRTKIEFNDSLTCIVGPNGSGKSNITDAIQWVLGEQSYQTLRGESMTDVIFKGTETRRPLGMAEVAMVFDNSTRILDTPYDTVEVRRKIYKNGDSKYFINNTSCRLKDIRSLFMDTGIGKDGYSIIGQGRVDSFLNSKASQRRATFEEASGISKQKFEKDETEKKLVRTEDQLNRIRDILKEVKDQKDSLEDQAQKAIAYREIYDHMKVKDTYWHIGQIKKINQTLRLEKESYREKKDKIQGLKKKNKEIQKDLDQIQEQINDLEELNNNYQALNIDNIKREKDLHSSIELGQERLGSLQGQRENIQIDLKTRTYSLDQLKDSINGEKNKLVLKEEDLSIIQEAKGELSKKIKDLEGRYSALQDRIELINAESNKVLIEETKLEAQRDNLKAPKSREDLDQDILDKKIKDLADSLLVLDGDLSILLDDIDQVKNKISTKEEDLARDKKKIESHRQEIYKIEKDQGQLTNDLSSKEVRHQALKNMESSYEGYNKSIRDFFNYLTRSNLEIEDLHGTVANLLRVPSKYDLAISTVLGAKTQNLVVETFESAKAIIKILDENKLGRITFLPLDNLRTYPINKQVKGQGFIDLASNLVDYDKKYQKVVDYLLGNILVVDNIDNARSLAKNYKNQIVSLNGEIIYPGGSVSGGKAKYSNNIFSRKNEILNLSQSIKEIKNNIAKNKLSLAKLKEEMDKALQEESNNTSLLDQLKEDLSAMEKKQYELKLSKDNILEKKADLDSQRSSYIDSLESSKSKYKDLEEKIQEKKSSRDKLEKDLLTYKAQAKGLEEDLNEKRLEIQDLQIKESQVQVQVENIKESIARLDKENKENKDSLDQAEATIARLDKDIKDLDENIRKNSESYHQVQEDLKAFNEEFERVKKQRLDLGEKFDKLNLSLNDLRQKEFDLDKDLMSLDNSISRQTTRIGSLRSHIAEAYKLSLFEDLDYISIDYDLAEEYMSYCKKAKLEISKLGSVDLSSIARYDEVKKRYEFNYMQYKDMEKTRQSLLEILEEISQVMEKKFIYSFKEINEKFSKIFRHMFSGGSAQLVLVDEDTEEPGVEIMVKLPGKKSQVLNALSGGERSMTAVSLLFAFLETRPSPFCLLDEVDAALDEGNIGRFTSYLNTLDNIQFALITHRTTTMEAADYIYGLTMEEQGVSKLVSLKFGEDD